MANNTGKKYGGRTKGTPNKITIEVTNKHIPNLLKRIRSCRTKRRRYADGLGYKCRTKNTFCQFNTTFFIALLPTIWSF